MDKSQDNQVNTKLEHSLESNAEIAKIVKKLVEAELKNAIPTLKLSATDQSSSFETKTGKLRDEILRLQDENERLYHAVEFSPNAKVMIDKTGKIVLANNEVERLFGYSREELIGEQVEKLIPQSFRSQHFRDRETFIKNPSKRRMGFGRDLYGLHKNGREFPVEVGLSPVRTSKGLYVLSSIIDISGRKQAEKLFQMAVEASPSAMIMVDRESRIMLMNAATEQLFRYKREELMGKELATLIPERFHDFLASSLAQLTQTVKVEQDLHGLRKDGPEILIEMGLNPIETEEDTFVLVSMIDVGIRRQLENEREAYIQQLSQANKDLEDFAYIASHDLKAPLRAIDNLSQWIAEDIEDLLEEDSDVRKHLKLMRSRVARLENLLEDLLQYSRAGKVDAADTQDIQLGVFLRNIIDLLDLPEGFEVILPKDLPSFVTAKSPLKHVFINLISNAVKHHDKDRGRIRISWKDQGDFYEFSVHDDGPGIPVMYQERVFQIFQTLVRRDEKEASGMGLAIVKKTIERHGGKVWLTSEEGKRGTTFSFTWIKNWD